MASRLVWRGPLVLRQFWTMWPRLLLHSRHCKCVSHWIFSLPIAAYCLGPQRELWCITKTVGLASCQWSTNHTLETTIRFFVSFKEWDFSGRLAFYPVKLTSRTLLLALSFITTARYEKLVRNASQTVHFLKFWKSIIQSMQQKIWRNDGLEKSKLQR